MVEGLSIRATVRTIGVAKNAIAKLLADLGDGYSWAANELLVDLDCTHVQCDEIWSVCYSEAKNVPEHRGELGYGDVLRWTTIDADTKLVPSWFVGGRSGYSAHADRQSGLSRQPA